MHPYIVLISQIENDELFLNGMRQTKDVNIALAQSRGYWIEKVTSVQVPSRYALGTTKAWKTRKPREMDTDCPQNTQGKQGLASRIGDITSARQCNVAAISNSGLLSRQ